MKLVLSRCRKGDAFAAAGWDGRIAAPDVNPGEDRGACWNASRVLSAPRKVVGGWEGGVELEKGAMELEKGAMHLGM
jgi:hypothetical protein